MPSSTHGLNRCRRYKLTAKNSADRECSGPDRRQQVQGVLVGAGVNSGPLRVLKHVGVNDALNKLRPRKRGERRGATSTTAENFSIGQVSCDGAIWPKIWTNLAPPDSSSISTVSVPT